MSAPTSLAIRSFTDRAEALSHCILRAGEAPRFMAYDDAAGCPTETILAALEWTRVTGVLPDEDLLHAGRLTTETAAAVIERRQGEFRRWIFIGPRLDTPAIEMLEGDVIVDEPGVRALMFEQRAMALAHFLRVTNGAGAIIAQLGKRAPEMRHVRRWLVPIIQELDGPRRMVAGWFAATGGGALFIGDDPEAVFRYIEVGIDS